jgi:Txe/YoeB family toxin of Txe-Axe toxin-antitoxin module
VNIKKSTVVDVRGLSRNDKELVAELADTLRAVEAIGKPTQKASSLERVIVSNLQSYTNLDGNYRKWVGRKRKFVQRIREQLEYLQNDIFGITTYKSETIQCKVQGCPASNKRVGIDTKFCSGCGRSF